MECGVDGVVFEQRVGRNRITREMSDTRSRRRAMADNADNSEQQYQPEQTGMYELEFPAPQLSSADGSGPVMIHALEGFSDAGHAIRLAAQYLKNTLDIELVASFAIDELL